MVESLEDKVNIEILKVDNNLIEIIIRGEQKNKNIGIIIDSIINKQLNYEKITSCSKEIKSGCLISVRGKGRSQITNIGDLTKKGKIKVQGKILL